MLTCRAYLWRRIHALDAPATSAHRLRHNADAISPLSDQRRFLRRPSKKGRYQSEVDKVYRDGEEPWKKSAVAVNQKSRQHAALRQTPPKVYETPNLANLGPRVGTMSDRDWENRKRELRYLQDPLELATFVKRELRKDKMEEMVQLVRMASHSMQCIVSWNHIIDHYLAKGRVGAALKLYNEMKKRQQFPDAYTYTILLRGLSMNAHLSGVLSKALSVYHSLSAPNSRVEPSIIHTNATLRVCARAMDMDALWGVAGKIPENGPQAANEVTYLTMINAIRQNVLFKAPKDETEDEAAVRRERAIMEGRKMWEGIVTRWRNADLKIDEELVCAMARLLLIGSRPRDWDDVLSLLEQTMDIPRMVPRLGTIDRKEAGLPQLRAPRTPAHLRFDDDHLGPDNSPMRGDEFLASTPRGVGSVVSNPLSYVRPGNNTLSIVQETCQKLVLNKAAEEYWEFLTEPRIYNIVPDLNNLHMRLRVFRLNRASAATLAFLEDEIVAKGIIPTPGTFRIALSTCVRDKNNHNSLRHAGRMLQIMRGTLEDADPKAVGMYASLVLTFPLVKGSDLVDALTVLSPIVRNIRLQLGVGGAPQNDHVGATYLKGEDRQDAIGVLRKVHGIYDKLLPGTMISEEQKAPFKSERARLASFIQRIVCKDQGKGRDLALDEGAKEVDMHGFSQNKNDAHDGVKGPGRRGAIGDSSWRKQAAKSMGPRKPWNSTHSDARGMA